MQDDVIVERIKHRGLAEYETFLRKFQYRNALDAALKVRCARAVVGLLCVVCVLCIVCVVCVDWTTCSNSESSTRACASRWS